MISAVHINSEAGRPLPQAPEMEQAVLGALLIVPEAWTKVSDILTPDIFHTEPNRLLYSAARAMWAKGERVDLLTLTDRMRRDGLLEVVGGPFYISQLTNKVASSANIEYHVRILIEHHIARSLIFIGSEAYKQAYEHPSSLDLLDRISGQITDLYGYTIGTGSTSAADGIGDLTDAKPKAFYSFGIPELDNKAVFQAGLPHVFAGRPGIGKSILAVEVMWHMTLAGTVLLFSPEMTKRQVQARIIARETGVMYSTIIRGRMTEQEVDIVSRCAMDIAGRLNRLKLDTTSGITPEQMRARTERAMKQDGIIAFGVDHLHEMRTGHATTDRKEFDRVSICMSGVTEIAKATDLPALVMCQLSRAVEGRGDKRPSLADLRGSGAIEEKAAVVGLLFREGYYMPDPPLHDTLEINVAKNRDGAVGLATAPIAPAFSRIGGAPVTFTPSFRQDTDDSPF